jgi:CDP-paratose 2-epimerase
MKILITGGCGFVGSSLAISLKKHYSNYIVIVLDNLKRRGSELNLSRLKSHGIEFIHGDIRLKQDLDQIKEVDFIIDAAAEPSVQAGLNGSPDYLIETNFMGTYNTLELSKRCNSKIIFLSTSRVYSIQALEAIDYVESENRFLINPHQSIMGISENGISEKFDISSYRSLYGTTKLASEMLVQEYNALFGLQSVINRCGVLTGPWQMGKVDQGFIVLWLSRHLWKGELSYLGYCGSGKQVRDILHVNDLYSLVDWQMHNMDKVNGEVFNVGGGINSSVSLKELTDNCSSLTSNKISIKSIDKNRQADIPIYVTDNSKITSLSGWEPTYTVTQTLQDILDWMHENEAMLRPILSQ